MSLADAVEFGASWTLVGFKPQVGQAGHRGGGDVLRFTVPLKPLTLVTVTVDVPVAPSGITREEGFAVMAKSGGGGGGLETTEKLTVVECERLPLVP